MNITDHQISLHQYSIVPIIQDSFVPWKAWSFSVLEIVVTESLKSSTFTLALHIAISQLVVSPLIFVISTQESGKCATKIITLFNSIIILLSFRDCICHIIH